VSEVVVADASPPKPLELSRYCVPFTPFGGKLEDAAICLVSTAAVRHRDDAPFDTEGDATWRVIASESDAKDLRYDDTHYAHACVDRDLNCVFPIDRVRELATERRVGGLTARHFSLGFSSALRDLRERTIPALVREVDRERPGAVLLTGG
jgi:D-proline reductase (dithiol) PrdB